MMEAEKIENPNRQPLSGDPIVAIVESGFRIDLTYHNLPSNESLVSF